MRRLGGVKLKEKRVENSSDAEDRGHNLVVCEMKCASAAGLVAHSCSSHPQ